MTVALMKVTGRFAELKCGIHQFSQDFLKSKSLPVSGKKGELIERIAAWLDAHP